MRFLNTFNVSNFPYNVAGRYSIYYCLPSFIKNRRGDIPFSIRFGYFEGLQKLLK